MVINKVFEFAFLCSWCIILLLYFVAAVYFACRAPVRIPITYPHVIGRQNAVMHVL